MEEDVELLIIEQLDWMSGIRADIVTLSPKSLNWTGSEAFEKKAASTRAPPGREALLGVPY